MKHIPLAISACLCIAFFLLLGARGHDEEPSGGNACNLFTLNALDYRTNIQDLRQNRPGLSRQLSDGFREYLGDLFFNGETFVVLENDRYTGHFIPLGEEKMPDSEFALFHSLRIYKRTFQVRNFPFLDRYLPYPAIEPNSFFGSIREPCTSVKLGIGQLYLLRLYHRTTVGDERIFLLKVVDLTPGVKVSVMWREIASSNEP